MTVVNITKNGQHNIAQYTEANVNVLPEFEQLNITPTTSSQTFVPQDGLYNQVNVSGVTSSIDNNIISENINKYTTILGVNGEYAGYCSYPSSYTVNDEGVTDFVEYTLIGHEFDDVTRIDTYGLYYAFYNVNSTNMHINIAGSLNFPELTVIDSHGMYYAFRGMNISSISFPKLTQVDEHGMYYAFYKNPIESVSFPELVNVATDSFSYCFYQCTPLKSVSLPKVISAQDSAFYYCFYNCSDLISVDFSNLENAYGTTGTADGAFYHCFGNCSSLQSIAFPKLKNIYGGYVFRQTFYNCTSLVDVDLSALEYVENNTIFDDMLKGCTGVTVHLPLALKNEMENWASVQNGFGGTDTVISFEGVSKTLEITGIPAGYEVWIGNTQVYNGDMYEFVENVENTILVISQSLAGTYTYVLDPDAEYFVFNLSDLNLSEIEITCDVQLANVDYEITAASNGNMYQLYLDQNNKIYLTSGFDYSVKATDLDNNYYIVPINNYDYNVTYVALHCIRILSRVQYTAQDILNLGTTMGQNQYIYLNPDDSSQLMIHPDIEETVECSIAIVLTFPENFNGSYRIGGSAIISSENNYDYGYVALGTEQILPASNDVKNDVIPSGSGMYIYKHCGETPTLYDFEDNMTNAEENKTVLTIGWAQDSMMTKGDNSLKVNTITVTYLEE